MKKQVYFQFPLMMLNGIFENKEKTLQDILSYSIVDFALKQEIDMNDAARQLLYNALRGGGLVEAETALKEQFDLEDVSADYGMFSCEANQQELTDKVIEILNKDPELKELAIRNCQLNKIDKFFGIEGPHLNTRLSRYKELKKKVDAFEAKYGTDPRPTIEKNLFFDLMKEPPEIFAMYAAIRSMEGRKQYARGNRPIITGRMTGAKNVRVLTDDPKRGKAFKEIKRYAFEKTLEKLFHRNLIKSMLRVKTWSLFYFSTKLTPKELGEAIAYHKNKRDAGLRNAEALKAFQQVNKTASI